MVSVYKSRINNNGITEHYCPNCKNWYVPQYQSKEESPDATIYREQYITGICSQRCWDQYLGILPKENQKEL